MIKHSNNFTTKPSHTINLILIQRCLPLLVKSCPGLKKHFAHKPGVYERLPPFPASLASETSQHLLRASYEPGLRLLFLLQFPQHPLEVGRQYSHPRFTDEITGARQSTSPRAMTSLTAELLKSNSLQEIWLGHCSDTARPLPASVSHLGEGAAPLEVPCRSRAGCCSCRPLCFHAQLRWLASLGSALFCFLLLDLLQTHSWQCC